jgi:hypothetical protein
MPTKLHIPPGMAHADVQQKLREHVRDPGGGAICPTCTQVAKVYDRKVHSGMAQALIIMYRHAGTEWFHLPEISGRWRSRDEGMLRYWGLIEDSTERREDGGKAGWWRVTPYGAAFVKGNAQIHKSAHVYGSRVLGLDGPLRTIHDCLGDAFDYNELMGYTP